VKILFLSHRIPYPPNKGDKIRSFHFLEYLAKSHEIYLGAFIDDPEEQKYIPQLRHYCREVHVETIGFEKYYKFIKNLIVGKPLSIAPFSSRSFSKWVRKIAKQHTLDIAYIFSSAMGQYYKSVNFPILMDFVDVDSNKWFQYSKILKFPMNLIYAREGKILQKYDRDLLNLDKIKKCIYVNSREMWLAREITPSNKIDFVENGVDIETSLEEEAVLMPRMIFVGLMNYLPNIEAVSRFALQIFPAIKRKIPDAEFDIVGMNPSREVLELSKIKGVNVIGAVPNVQPYLRRSKIFVAPFNLSQGIPNKILEAMAARLPVVTVPSIVSLLHDVTSQQIVSTNNNVEFADKCVRLLSNETERRLVANNAQLYVIKHYNWNDKYNKLDCLMHEAMTSK